MASEQDLKYSVFRRVRKITKSDNCPLSCLSVRPFEWNNSASKARIFMKFYIIFRNSVEKINLSLKSDKNK